MNKKKYIQWTLILLAVYAVVLLGVWLVQSGILSGDNRLNVLVLGTDNDKTRTDVIMVAQVDFKDDAIRLLSVPRDTRVTIGRNPQKINSAYAIGGVELSQKAVTELTNIPIDHYLTVDFDAFVEIVDLLGGVDFDVPQDMKYSDPVQDLYIDLKKGPQHLNGEQAEQLVRFRMYPLGDLQRVEVQQNFIKALVDQKLTFGNLFKAGALMDIVKEHTETSLSKSVLTRLLPFGLGFDAEQVESYQLPGSPQMRGGISYYICDEAKTEALVEEKFAPGNE